MGLNNNYLFDNEEIVLLCEVVGWLEGWKVMNSSFLLIYNMLNGS